MSEDQLKSIGLEFDLFTCANTGCQSIAPALVSDYQ